MAEVHGIKETKEALLGVVALGAFVMERAKDGVKLDDAMALAAKLVSDPEFTNKLKLAIDGSDKIPAEVGELSFAEIIELAKVLPELLSVFKK